MSDWEVVTDNKTTKNPQIQTSSDWEVIHDVPNSQKLYGQESLSGSLMKAPFRVGEDVIRSGYNFLKNIPDYYQSAKTEIPGLPGTLLNHPMHALGQGAAGLTELGHGLLNAPHDIAQYAANRLNLLPKSIPGKIPVQQDISENINQLFGQPSYPGESLIRGASKNALNLMGAGELASIVNPLKLTSKNIAKDVLNTANQNKKIYSNLYNNLFEEAKNKGFGDLSTVKPSIDIDTLREYSPKRSIVGVEDFLSKPTIENAHKAKSDLLTMERKLNKLTTFNTAEGKQYTSVRNAIDEIKNSMFKDKSGVVDNKLLDKYNRIQQGYSTEVVPYKNKEINKFRQGKISSTELVNSLSKGEFAALRGSYHPEIKYRNLLHKHPYLTGAGIGSLGATIYHNMMGNTTSNE